MPSIKLTLNAVFVSLAALARSITRCGIDDEDNERIQQVVQDGEDGINRITIPMIVVTPPDADPTLCVERAMARANAPPSRIPIPNGGLTSARRARQVLQEVFDGTEHVAAEAIAFAEEWAEQDVVQREMITSTIAGMIESMRDSLDDLEEGEEGGAPSA